MQNDFLESMAATRVELREVGMREGLQSHKAVLSTEQKVEMFKMLADAGCREINPVAFVNPGKMPQMADAEEVLERVAPYAAGINISGTVLNERGLERAIRMKDRGLMQTALLVFSTYQAGMAANGITADTETLFSQILRCGEVCASEDIQTVVFISGAFGDEDRVDPELIYHYAERLDAAPGIGEILISDSTGQADPIQIYNFFCGLAQRIPTDKRIGLHMHDTRGAGLANIAFALASPFNHMVLDSSFGGWGGDYPFVDDSLGNVPTEDLVEMLFGMGIDLGIDVDKVLEVTRYYHELVGRGVGSKMHFASGPIAWKRERSAASSASAS